MRKIDNSIIEKVKNYHSLGMNDYEIAQQLDISDKKVHYIRKTKLNLSSNFEYSSALKDKKKIIEDYINEGKTNIEISNLLNVSNATLGRFLQKHKFKSRLENPPIKFSYYQEQILKGSLLGDASLHLRNINPYFTCEHGEKQKNYCFWKYEQLINLNATYSEYQRKTKDIRNGKYYKSAIVRLGANSEFHKLYKNLYDENRVKYISSEFLEGFSELSLAVMYMDDGFFSGGNYNICTNCFTVKGLEIFNNYCFTKWGIKFTIRKRNILYLPAKYRSLFTFLIKDYIHKDLLYKIETVS